MHRHPFFPDRPGFRVRVLSVEKVRGEEIFANLFHRPRIIDKGLLDLQILDTQRANVECHWSRWVHLIEYFYTSAPKINQQARKLCREVRSFWWTFPPPLAVKWKQHEHANMEIGFTQPTSRIIHLVTTKTTPKNLTGLIFFFFFLIFPPALPRRLKIKRFILIYVRVRSDD